MESKIDITNKARSLMDTSHQEAIDLFEQVWTEYNDQFNAWDALFLLKAMRKNLKHNSTILNEVVERFKEDEKVSGVYSWYIFDRYVKNIDKTDLLSYENLILKSFEITHQKDQSDKHEFPCAFTISVFHLIDANAENQFNAKKITKLLEYLDPNLLSTECRKTQTADNQEKEQASDKEKYYSVKSKVLIKLCLYEECIDICDKALKMFTNFHYNNDTWFVMRKAICFEKLGNHEESEKLFQEILSTKAGSDKWFIYKDLADFYFELKNYEKAWKYSVDSAYYGNEPEFMVNLYLLQARILFKLNRHEDGRILANLLASIFLEFKRNPKDDFIQLFKYYNIINQNIEPLKESLNKAKKLFLDERYKGNKRKTGVIINIQSNGKRGIIKSDIKGKIIFSKRDFRKNIRDITNLVDTKIEFYLMRNFKDDYTAEDIVILENQKTESIGNQIVGKIFRGRINSIKEIGVFVKLPDQSHGLIHKYKMPKKIQDDFMNTFKLGDEIDVEVVEVSAKGIALKII